MKKLINHKTLIASIFIITALFSCTELEDESFNNIVSKDFTPTTEQEIASIVGSTYVAWRQTFLLWNGVWRSQEVSADQIVIPARPNGWVDGGVYRRIHEHNWTALEDNVFQGWNRTYSGITNCNRVIYQIESDILPLGENAASTLAELKVLRASYYYILMDLYGNVPIVTDFDVPEGFLPEQKSRAEVYQFVVKEILDNIDMLSEANDGTTYARFNKWAAYTLLAKIYLNAEVYTGIEQWGKCIEACDAVINSGAGYILEPDQKNVFVTENEGSKEIIFALPIDETYTTDWNTFDVHMQSLQPANQTTYKLLFSPWGGMCAIPQFIDTFDPEDSRLTQNFIYGQQYSASGEMLMGTLGASSGQPLAYINELPGVDQSEEIHGYRFGKFEIEVGSSNILNNDFPLFRYADVLMMKAECLLRNSKADEAAQIVSQVRERSFKANPSKATVTGDQLMQGSVYDYGLRNHLETTAEGGADVEYGRFLDELAWEFNQEGRRRQDMIRFGVYTTKSWLSHSASADYKKLYPIPQTEINNNINLGQNYGYD